jgi:DNA-binding winged helix-turn-helix (wHTH) protein/TolB-like protein/Tfp pilus assembly protein PilF
MSLPREIALHPDARLRIGDLLVDPASHRLQRDGEPRPLRIERSSFDLLLALAARPGAVVSKEDLLAAVWPGRVVSDNSLAQAVRKLRTALGDTDGTAVQLVRGFGYRLALPVVAEPVAAPAASAPAPIAPAAAAPVAIERPSPPPAARFADRARALPALARSRAFWAGGLAALVLAGASAAVIAWRDAAPRPATPTTERRQVQELHNTLAVLPFADLSGDRSLAREALLLSDGLRRDGHRIPQLHAAAESEVRAFDGSPDDPEAVLAALDADLVLAGTLRPHPVGFELTLRLVDHSGQGLGFEHRYEVPRGELGELQARLRFDLYEHLAGTPDRWGHDPARGSGTANREAWLAFLRAATVLGDDEAGQRRAKAALEQAVALDPNYADAWIALGSLLGAGGGAGGTFADDSAELAQSRKHALAALDRGISLAPNEPGHYLLRSEIRHLYFYDWEGAQADLDRAEALMPKPTAHLYIQRARLAASRGDLRAALEFDDRATALDPESGSQRNKGWHLIALGEYAKARELLLREHAVRPFESSLNYYLGLCDLYEGLPEAALARFEQAGTVHRLTGTVLAHVRRGDREAARRALGSLEQRFADTAAYEIAIGHAWLDEPDAAFEWLERAIAVGDGGVLYLGFDPLVAPLRKEARFVEVLVRIGFPGPGAAASLSVSKR